MAGVALVSIKYIHMYLNHIPSGTKFFDLTPFTLNTAHLKCYTILLHGLLSD